jgi:hypothetical protein
MRNWLWNGQTWVCAGILSLAAPTVEAQTFAWAIGYPESPGPPPTIDVVDLDATVRVFSLPAPAGVCVSAGNECADEPQHGHTQLSGAFLGRRCR